MKFQICQFEKKNIINLIFPNQALTVITSYKNLTFKNQDMHVSLKKLNSKCYFCQYRCNPKAYYIPLHMYFLYLCMLTHMDATAHMQGSENDLRESVLVLHQGSNSECQIWRQEPKSLSNCQPPGFETLIRMYYFQNIENWLLWKIH